MEHLWAPWRAEYFYHKKPKECIFCLKASQRDEEGHPADDEKNYLLIRERTCFAMLNAFPYIGGHLMVAPYRHTGEMNDLTEDELRDLFLLARQCKNLLSKTFKPDGFNLGFNIGMVAGAGMIQHLHFHVVPRWTGDTNFMTVLADTRVASEGLKETYQKLKHAMENES